MTELIGWMIFGGMAVTILALLFAERDWSGLALLGSVFLAIPLMAWLADHVPD
jgi:hypothetical protein